MSTFSSMLGRRDLSFGESDSTLNLMIGFLAIVFFSLCLASSLIMLRRIKLQRQMNVEDGLPKYQDLDHQQGRNINRLNIHTADGRSSILVLNNGRPMLSDPSSPPHSPSNVPEIHITFPDEHDDQGRQQNGRVVVVRVGETSIGLEPYKEEQLPAYQKENAGGFYSIDMNQIGGLKEKERTQFS
ncbi:uncharacterized protein B0I36DRAFT_70206 [Microdochium trichocladiopsis]|uniref:Uncharacterized protein n=1 Tax=Microdochium trichocladiopsis TaxID=1682393 RepID=A0A9P8YGL4_9PEZI|nr:uncharacterized protein B0I36DRAFT_70206 [Microdochium trichocladiopsis]KAH7037725.1 hypothetical protein B0I36DRAFT_70206 [Microdochium trichocladiopsis]